MSQEETFQKHYLAKLDKRYEDVLFLNDTFEKLSESVEDFARKLYKYREFGLDVSVKEEEGLIELQVNEEVLIISIEEGFNMIRVSYVDELVSNPQKIDFIKPPTKTISHSLYRELGLEKAFDKYLERTFKI